MVWTDKGWRKLCFLGAGKKKERMKQCFLGAGKKQGWNSQSVCVCVCVCACAFAHVHMYTWCTSISLGMWIKNKYTLLHKICNQFSSSTGTFTKTKIPSTTKSFMSFYTTNCRWHVPICRTNLHVCYNTVPTSLIKTFCLLIAAICLGFTTQHTF